MTRLSMTLLCGLLLVTVSSLQAQETAEDCGVPQRYTFSWTLDPGCDTGPRGGTTPGPEVTLDPEPHPGWQALQEDGLSRKERDRRAILAMAGPYRTSFEFLETVGYTADFERARPYQSWSTEYVYVVEDSEDFISLQHIIVMFVKQEDGSLRGPFVQKHWRQDWQYEQQRLLVYDGQDTWRWKSLSPEAVEGSWTQSVFQVDDSPRYAARGRWQHSSNLSTWRSALTRRPLPRRESSVRDDYQLLEGWNRHTITPRGWIHEEENYKLRLNDQGEPVSGNAYLAKELGVNRYDRIVDFDFTAGDRYWEETEDYWAIVRDVWSEAFNAEDTFELRDSVDGVPLFAVFFEAAQDWRSGELDRQSLRPHLEQALAPYLKQ